LELYWQTPPAWRQYKACPLNFVSHLLGHEGESALASGADVARSSTCSPALRLPPRPLVPVDRSPGRVVLPPSRRRGFAFCAPQECRLGVLARGRGELAVAVEHVVLLLQGGAHGRGAAARVRGRSACVQVSGGGAAVWGRRKAAAWALGSHCHRSGDELCRREPRRGREREVSDGRAQGGASSGIFTDRGHRCAPITASHTPGAPPAAPDRYLALISAHEDKWEGIHEEVKNLSQIRFDFRDKPKPYDYVTSLSGLMQQIPERDLLKAMFHVPQVRYTHSQPCAPRHGLHRRPQETKTGPENDVSPLVQQPMSACMSPLAADPASDIMDCPVIDPGRIPPELPPLSSLLLLLSGGPAPRSSYTSQEFRPHAP